MCDTPNFIPTNIKGIQSRIDGRTHQMMNSFLRKISDDHILSIHQFNFQKTVRLETNKRYQNMLVEFGFCSEDVFKTEEYLLLSLMCSASHTKGLLWTITELPKIEETFLNVFKGTLQGVEKIKIIIS